MQANAATAEAASLNASASMDELMQLGETTYTAYCAACHQVSGQGLPPAFPALKGSAIATTGPASAHIDIVVNGKAGTGMQAYGKQLSLKEIAAVVTYERNAWGNNTGEAVQAADVQSVSGASTSDTVEKAVEEVKEQVVATVAKVIPKEDLSKVYSQDELMALGEDVYMTACAACHQATGEGMAPVFPALKGSVIATGDVAVHLDMVLNGSKKNPAMAAFAGQLTKTQIAAVVTYERNAWGNNTGDLVQPAAVVAAASAK
jgi:cytochrome c oxidase subunit 2